MTDNIGSIQDPSVSLEATPELLKFVSDNEDFKDIAAKLREEPKLGLSDLRIIQKLLQNANPGAELRGQQLDSALSEMVERGDSFVNVTGGPYLHELLKGATVNLPKNPVIDRNPVLAARVERLRREQDERAYQTMTKNISAGKFYKEDTVAYQMNMMNRQLIAVGQVVLSVAAGFAFGFFGVPLAVGGLEFGVRILLGLLAAIIIAIAELYFLAKYMVAEDNAQDKDSEEVKPTRPHHD